MKKIVLISNYYHFAQEKSSNRYRELVDLLCNEEDLEVEVITSKFYQRTYKHRENIEELCKGIKYKATFIDEPGYSKSICLERLISSYTFGKGVIKYLKSQPKPDLIYQVVPTLDVANFVSNYANKQHIPLVIDVQDLWPEAFKMAINIPVITDIAFMPFMWLVNSIYRRADAICAVSQTYVDRILKVNKKCQSGTPVYIGINLQKFDENSKDVVRNTSDRLKLAYCGSLSKSYDIKLVIDALALMENPPLFLVMGDGNDREEFQAYAKEKNVQAEFTGFIPYDEMCSKLCSCDMTINPIVGTSVASIINKHGDYAASGLPVINTQASDEYCKLVTDYNMGFNSVGKDATDLAEKIRILMDDRALRIEMGKNARRCAEEKFDRRITYKRLVDVIRSMV